MSTDKISIHYSFNIGIGKNQKGFVATTDDESIIFGNRDIKNITNTLSGKLNFNIKSSLGIAFRYYWAPVEYDDQFFSLNADGSLSPHNYSENEDINFNLWNLDVTYAWEFAPGSQLVAQYRNSISNSDHQSDLSFSKNLKNLFFKNCFFI